MSGFFSKNLKEINITLVVLIFLCGMYLRFEARNDSAILTDERYQISLLEKPVPEMIQEARRFTQFPGDSFLVLPFHKIFGSKNKWGLAIPHIIVTIAGYYILYLLCKKYFSSSASYVITFSMFSLNRNLVFHAFEIRPYGVLAIMGIAIFLVMQYIFENQHQDIQKKILVSIFAICTLLFHLYGSFMMFFSYVFHLCFSRKKETVRQSITRHFKDYWIALTVASPFLFYLMSADKSYMKYDVFQFIPKEPISFLKGVIGNLVGDKRMYVFLLGIVCAFFIPNRERIKQIAFVVIMVVIPIGLTLISCVANQYWFVQRLFVWMMPLFAFFVGWCWDSCIVFAREKL